QFARINAAKRPADNADAAAITIGQFLEAVANALPDFRARPPVAAKLPWVHLIAQRLQILSEHECRAVGSEHARQYENGMTVAARRVHRRRERGHDRAEFEKDA